MRCISARYAAVPMDASRNNQEQIESAFQSIAAPNGNNVALEVKVSIKKAVRQNESRRRSR